MIDRNGLVTLLDPLFDSPSERDRFRDQIIALVRPDRRIALITAVLDNEGAAIEPATYATLRAVLAANGG